MHVDVCGADKVSNDVASCYYARLSESTEDRRPWARDFGADAQRRSIGAAELSMAPHSELLQGVSTSSDKDKVNLV